MLMTTAVRAATLNTVGNDASALRDVKTAMAAITDPAAMADVHSIQLELSRAVTTYCWRGRPSPAQMNALLELIVARWDVLRVGEQAPSLRRFV